MSGFHVFTSAHQYMNLPWQKYMAITSIIPIKLRCIRMLCASSECPQTREVVEYLDNLKNYEKSVVPENAGIDTIDGFDLDRMRRLLDRLDNPQSKYKVVHIAGTKGKGSTSAFLSNILRAEGYSVGCYTSPHIRTICERITVGKHDKPVSTAALCSIFHRTKKMLDQAVSQERGFLSHFEVLTALAFTVFADQNVDIAVIEAGLGGARDATNIISSSELAAAVITTIGKEHLAALGGSLETIALAKSGIIKHGCPSIELQVVNVLMLRHHQLQNAATATCAALCLRDQGWKISDGSIRSALESRKLLGRSQFLIEEEIEALGLCGSMVLLDGGSF